MRLKSKGRTDVGTVEIRTEDGWTQVCDRNWGDVDAKVLCREMGYVDGKALCCSRLGETSSGRVSRQSFTNFHCIGNETNLINCTHRVDRDRCGSKKKASAICYEVNTENVNNGKWAQRTILPDL